MQQPDSSRLLARIASKYRKAFGWDKWRELVARAEQVTSMDDLTAEQIANIRSLTEVGQS